MESLLKGNVFAQISANHVKVGDKLKFKAVMPNLSTFHSAATKGELRIISVVPSLNTSVCTKQTQTLSYEIQKMPHTRLITISCDLPFASNRICDIPKDPRHVVVSDYRFHDFANKTGLLLKDLGFLCRALIILNHNDEVLYVQIANPVTSTLDIKEIINFIASHTKTP